MSDERNRQNLPSVPKRKYMSHVEHCWVVGVPLYKNGNEWIFDDTEGPIDISDFIMYEREIMLRPDISYELKQLVRNIIKAQMETKRLINRMMNY